MSEPAKAQDRPQQVTVAAWLIMVGSVFVVLMVWDRIAGLHTIQSRQSLQSTLDDPGLKGLGLQLTDLMVLVKTLSMVAAGCATAMAILGYQALQRSRSARLALTVFAFPLFLTGLVTGGFVSSGVAAAVGTLWLRPSRLWFGDTPSSRGSSSTRALDGRTSSAKRGLDSARAPEKSVRPPEESARPPEHVTGAPPYAAPWPGASSSAPTQTSAAPSGWAPPPTSAYGSLPVTAFGSSRTSARPTALLWASIVTWFFSGVAAVVLAASMLVLADDSSLVLDKMHQQNPDLAGQGITDHMILVVCFVMCSAFIVWAVVAAVFAALAYRRVRWAWYALVISTTGVIGLCVLGSIGSLFLLLPLAGAAAAISLLVRPEVRRWFGLR
jgi:hypothetical protein